jgi:alkylation response protein AidB-like acyl-CoA dehydrogenase
MGEIRVNVNFVLNEEQVQLRESVRRWSAANGLSAGKTGAEPALWAELAELGLTMAGLPEEVGGLGGTVLDVAVIAEELGRELVRQPYVDIAVASAQLLLDVAPGRLEPVIAGESRPLLAHDESGARGMIDWVQSSAAKSGDGFVLNGRKTGLLGIDHADTLIVSARLDGELALFWVPVEAVKLIRYVSLDGRPGATAILSDASVPREALLDSSPNVVSALSRAAAYGQVIAGAEALGAMRGAFAATRDYVAIRKQFKQRIGDFQVVRHVLADMLTEIEQSHSLVWRAVAALTDDNERDKFAAAVKVKASRAGLFVGDKGIQLHGGVGMTEEYAIGQYYKHLLVFSQRHGTADDHLRRYASLLSAATQVD